LGTLFSWPFMPQFLLILVHKECSFVFHHCYLLCLWYMSGSSWLLENSYVPPLPTTFPEHAWRLCITASRVVPAMLTNVSTELEYS
jgi:hypothetical protein